MPQTQNIYTYVHAGGAVFLSLHFSGDGGTRSATQTTAPHQWHHQFSVCRHYHDATPAVHRSDRVYHLLLGVWDIAADRTALGLSMDMGTDLPGCWLLLLLVSQECPWWGEGRGGKEGVRERRGRGRKEGVYVIVAFQSFPTSKKRG